MHMEPVSGGFVPHKIKGDGDYEAQKRAALAQAGRNDYTQGIQTVFADGAGQPIKDSRTKYGNVNIMPQQVLEGADSNFQQKDTPGNMILEDPVNQTGSHQLSQSATKTTQQDPQEFETAALDRRLAMMAKGGMSNLNNVSSLY